MTDRRPDLDELVGELDAADRDRLQRVHDLLLDAGPPPELPPELVAPPAEPRARIIPFPRRYKAAVLGVAAAVAVGLFGIGYAIGHATSPEKAFTVAMTGSGASGELVVFAKDAAGNWPMELSVHGLPKLAPGTTYELWLTKGGKLAATGADTEVPLNAPYVLRDYDGWVVVPEGSTAPVLRTSEI